MKSSEEEEPLGVDTFARGILESRNRFGWKSPFMCQIHFFNPI